MDLDAPANLTDPSNGLLQVPRRVYMPQGSASVPSSPRSAPPVFPGEPISVNETVCILDHCAIVSVHNVADGNAGRFIAGGPP